MRWWSLCTNMLSWIFIVLAHWNTGLRVDMSPHSETLSWFPVNLSLLFLLNAVSLTEKQQIQILVFGLTRYPISLKINYLHFCIISKKSYECKWTDSAFVAVLHSRYSIVFNKEHNSYPEMSVKLPIACRWAYTTHRYSFVNNQNGGRLIIWCRLYVDKIIFLAQKGPCGLNFSAALCPANTVLFSTVDKPYIWAYFLFLCYLVYQEFKFSDGGLWTRKQTAGDVISRKTEKPCQILTTNINDRSELS
jgi:hypothetical protein